MKPRGNRDRILNASIELYNHSGTVAITTNHIAKFLAISPGNLYFHFANKEEIIRELFDRMTQEIYEAWDPLQGNTPQELVEKSFEIFWSFRFFHREMYHLRRMDPLLSRKWKGHLNRCSRLLRQNHAQWVNKGMMRPMSDPTEMKMVSDLVLVSSSAYLSFFESPERIPSKKTLRAGVDHVNKLFERYL